MTRALLLLLALLLLFVASSSAQGDVVAAANDTSDRPPADEEVATANDTEKGAYTAYQDCSFDRDVYCFGTTDAIDDLDLDRIPRNEVKVALSELDTSEPDEGLGIGLSTDSKMEVEAYAIGVIIKDIFDVDALRGKFKAKLKLYLFKIRPSPFESFVSAIAAIYNNTTRTTRNTVAYGDGPNEYYYKLHDESLQGISYVWGEGARTDDGRLVVPDGVCSQYANENLASLTMDEYRALSFQESLDSASLDPKRGNDGSLHHISATLNIDFKPFNRRFYPFQVDLLDMFFRMTQSNLLGSDIIRKNLMCLHPMYSGFGRHVVGVESKHDKLTMIPYLATTLSEPWWFERGHFSYSLEEKREQLRQGNLLNRVLAVRIKVEHANHKGWLASFGFFFASLSALLSFVSDNAFSVNSSSMLRAIISVNTLVSSNMAYLAGGSDTIQSWAVYLAYAVNGSYIVTVTLMALINRLKSSGEDRWFMRNQGVVYSYMRLVATSLCFFYLPLFTAFATDTTDGSQETKTWVWVLSILLVALSFLLVIARDIRGKMKEKRKVAELDQVIRDEVAASHASKPFSSWTQEETTLWVKTGEMSKEGYFTDTTRDAIAEKLDSARVDGGLLGRIVEGGDVMMLVNAVGLSLGDADKLFVEVKRVMQPSDGGAIDTAMAVGNV